MSKIDKVVFGDNQFFGINHMSQGKGKEQAERFSSLDNIFEVYDNAFNAGVSGVMLNSHDRAMEICDVFRSNKEKYGHINFYPSVPYPHKYANLVAEKGLFSAIKSVLFSSGKNNALNKIKSGTSAVLMKDAVALMKMLVDLEMEAFDGLNIKVVFLQNIITDLLLGMDQKLFLTEYCNYVKERYGARAGLITQNLPKLKRTLEEWGVEDVVICASINKIGYLMSPSVEDYITAIKENDPEKYPIMAMSTLASGAIKPDTAYEFVNSLDVQSVVFGASSKKNIESTVNLIDISG